MNCPKCSSKDFYLGLMGPDCANSKCYDFKNGTITGKSNWIEQSKCNWIGEDSEYPGFAILIPQKICYRSSKPVLVSKQQPHLVVVQHDPTFKFLGLRTNIIPWEGDTFSICGKYVSGTDINKLIEIFSRTFPDLQPEEY